MDYCSVAYRVATLINCNLSKRCQSKPRACFMSLPAECSGEHRHHIKAGFKVSRGLAAESLPSSVMAGFSEWLLVCTMILMAKPSQKLWSKASLAETFVNNRLQPAKQSWAVVHSKCCSQETMACWDLEVTRGQTSNIPVNPQHLDC